MQGNDTLLEQGLSAAPAVSAGLRERLTIYLTPILQDLDAYIDRRLVRTLRDTVEAVLVFRNRAMGLLLSELGGYLLSPDHAPAGTKRLSNLLRSRKWNGTLLEAALWHQADEERQQLLASGQPALVLWDESVNEKPESIASDELGSVRSSKAHRLTRIKKGYYTPPKGPVFVPGFRWICLLVCGCSDPPCVAAMQWWTNRGQDALEASDVKGSLLLRCAEEWGSSVLHVWDRGEAGGPWLSLALSLSLRFVVRWPKRYHLLDATGRERCAWEIARGKKAWDQKEVRVLPGKPAVLVKVLALPVSHPRYAGHPLTLVVARQGKGKEPWYLLTTEPVETPQAAWEIVFAYTRRWQIEMTFRYTKSELAMESPRLWTLERRVKMLLIVTLAYAFLLSLLIAPLAIVRQWLLRFFCHRNGKRGRDTPAPLCRLRSALSRLWTTYPQVPSVGNSG